MKIDPWSSILCRRQHWSRCDKLSPTGHKCQISHYSGPDEITDVLGNPINPNLHFAQHWEGNRSFTEKWED